MPNVLIDFRLPTEFPTADGVLLTAGAVGRSSPSSLCTIDRRRPTDCWEGTSLNTDVRDDCEMADLSTRTGGMTRFERLNPELLSSVMSSSSSSSPEGVTMTTVAADSDEFEVVAEPELVEPFGVDISAGREAGVCGVGAAAGAFVCRAGVLGETGSSSSD